MADHGEQPVDSRRALVTPGGVGRSFADAWGAEPPTADLAAASFDQAGLLPAPQASSDMTPMGDLHAPSSSASASQTMSVTVSRPLRTDTAAAGSALSEGDDHLTVEIRREGGETIPGRPPERIVVTVSSNRASEQLSVTF